MKKLEKVIRTAHKEATEALDAYGNDDCITKLQKRGIRANTKFALSIIHVTDQARKGLHRVRQRMRDTFEKTK